MHRKRSQFPLCPYNKFRSKVETKITLSMFTGKTEISYIMLSNQRLGPLISLQDWTLYSYRLLTLCTSVGPTCSRRLESLSVSLSLSLPCTHTHYIYVRIHIIYMDIVITHIPLSKNIRKYSLGFFSSSDSVRMGRSMPMPMPMPFSYFPSPFDG